MSQRQTIALIENYYAAFNAGDMDTFFEVKDNKICRVTNYYNLEDWIAQVSE